MNVEAIKSDTRNHFLTEDKEDLFNEKLQVFKCDIIKEYRKWKVKYPQKNFEDFKMNSYQEMNGFSPQNGPNLSIGIYMIALDLINPLIDLK